MAEPEPEPDPLVEELKKAAHNAGVPLEIVNKLIKGGILSLKMVEQLDDETITELKISEPHKKCLKIFMETLDARTREATRDKKFQELDKDYSGPLLQFGISRDTISELQSAGILSAESLKLVTNEQVNNFKVQDAQKTALKVYIHKLNNPGGIQIKNANVGAKRTGEGSVVSGAILEMSGEDLKHGINMDKVDVKGEDTGKNSKLSVVQWGKGSPSNAAARSADINPNEQNRVWDLTDGPTDVKVEPCTNDFFEKHKDGAYPMQRKNRGKALIINVETVGCSDPRRGTNMDRDKLDALLQQLHFQVTVYNDSDGLSAQEIRTKLTDFAVDVNRDETEAIVVCMLSHGEKGGILSTDGNIVAYEEIFTTFDDRKCEKLIGKPKLFIFQACRGDEPDPGVGSSHGPLQTCAMRAPSDMFMWYATQESYRTFRDTTNGSWFIEAIVKVFMRCAKDKEILVMTKLVHDAVCSKVPSAGKKQGPECRHNLHKKLYFFPGIQK